MLFNGYLKASDTVLTPEDLTVYTLQVPNREVRTVFTLRAAGVTDILKMACKFDHEALPLVVHRYRAGLSVEIANLYLPVNVISLSSFKTRKGYEKQRFLQVNALAGTGKTFGGR